MTTHGWTRNRIHILAILASLSLTISVAPFVVGEDFAAAQESANTAQDSADTAQASANQAGLTALVAGDVSVWGSGAVQMVNKRVSELADYKTIAEADIYVPTNSSTLDTAAKADLDTLTANLSAIKGYTIEVAGYTSSTGSDQYNQKLSNERATAVTDYLRKQDNIPMRRILVPAGYGAFHPAESNLDAQGRALNRRVEIRVLVNTALAEQ